jgi:hypothetical protein
MKDNQKLILTGKFPEIEMKDVHYCCVPECPRDDITLFIGMDISAPKSKIGDILTEILNFRRMIEQDPDDAEWHITLERSPHKQAKLPTNTKE